jgi:hypothetical protein
MKLFTVYDSASKTYSEPRAIKNERDAQDAFEMACKQEDNPFNKHPADYTLMELGWFDERTGILESQAPKTIINGATFLDAPSTPQ